MPTMSKKHPEETSNGSDICDFLKVSDFNELYEMSKISPQNNLNDTTQFREDLMEIYI